MKEIFEQYGGIVITVTAILAIILIIRLVIGNDLTSPIGMAFKELIENFMKKAPANRYLRQVRREQLLSVR